MNIGLIGCGALCRRSHLPALRRLPWANVWSVYDQDNARAHEVATEFGVPNVRTSFDNFLSDADLHTAVILTPPAAYADLAPPLLQAGKNVLLEKSLAGNGRDAIYVRQAAEESAATAHLGVAFNYRYYPAIQHAKNRLSVGALGRPVSIHIVLHQHFPLQWDLSEWRFASGAGVLEDLAPHTVDLLLWLIDDVPVSVTAFGQNPTAQFPFVTHATIVLEFRNGTVGLAEVSWLTGPMTLRLALWGTGGRLFVDPLFGGVDEQHGVATPVNDTLTLLSKLRYTLAHVVRRRMFWDPGVFYTDLYTDFKGYLDGTHPSFPNARWARGVQSVIDAARRSLAESKPISLTVE